VDNSLGHALLRHARSAIAERLAVPLGAIDHHPLLDEPGATFVTLMQGDAVRGCVGTLEPVRPLRVDVRKNAQWAAFRDFRFAPLARDEFEITSVEVSLLGPSERLAVAHEAELFACLRVGIDGVTLEYGPLRATFLPQVWEHLRQPTRFFAELKRKAGLPADFWSAQMNIYRYQVTKWKESELLPSHTQS
jgi:AmmeMemoRadiSam system protein A